MRTARTLTVQGGCLLWEGGIPGPRGGSALGGVPGLGDVCSRGCVPGPVWEDVPGARGGIPGIQRAYLSWGGVCSGGCTWSGGVCSRGCAWSGTPPPPLWTEFLTHASENITLPQTSFAGGNKKVFQKDVYCLLALMVTPLMATRCHSGQGWGTVQWGLMYKFEHFSSDGHQMSLAGGVVGGVLSMWGGGVVQCGPMHHG